MTFIYEMGSSRPVGYIPNYFTSGSSQSVFVGEVDHGWTCQYCGGLVKSDLNQCPRCAGERRPLSSYQSSRPMIQYAEDETFNVNMNVNIKIPPAGLLERIRTAMKK